MNTTTYVLNPNYRFLDDVKRVLLVAVDNENSDSRIDYSSDFISKIHPLHAQILSFFNGDNDYQNTIDKLVYCDDKASVLWAFRQRQISHREVNDVSCPKNNCTN